MSDVVLIDTSVFLQLLGVQGYCTGEQRREAQELLQMGAQEGWTFLLPWATVLETGNHIGQVPDGHHRRQAAMTFVEAVSRSLSGDAPWSPAQPLDAARFAALLGEFVVWAATHGSGLGDLSIRDEWERQRRMNPRRRVWIWSLDKHLSGYDTYG